LDVLFWILLTDIFQFNDIFEVTFFNPLLGGSLGGANDTAPTPAELGRA
jgi:hypothetical protein